MHMRVDLSALLRHGHGDAIAVAGVHAGDAAASIDRGLLTAAEDDAPDELRTYAGASVYRHGPDGTQAELPLAERVDAVLQRGGWLHSGEIALRVTQGRIERIVVRGPSLASLKILREDHIARRLGPASGHERELEWRLHHYPDRNLVVAWHSRDGYLEHVVLGPDPWREPRLGTEDLLSELLGAFEALRPHGSEPPPGSARVRYRRIAALARAFELGTIPELMTGKLSSLLHYRADLERVAHATPDWPEHGDPAWLGLVATQRRLGAQIAEMLIDIDRWLCLLMDPAQRTFELKELIASHGWPDVDLRVIERDERR
jgi:hypothetical protein